MTDHQHVDGNTVQCVTLGEEGYFALAMDTIEKYGWMVERCSR